jgi:hypothetical protein
VVIAEDAGFVADTGVIGLGIRIVKGTGIIRRVVRVCLETPMAGTCRLTLLIVPIIKALLSASRAIGETRIEVLRGSILTLTQIGATSLTSSMLKACATGTPIGSCALDPGTQTLRRCSFAETRPR